MAVYAQVAGHGYLNFDDPEYVRDNASVQGGLSLAALRWAFTTFESYNWAPLTWLSHLLDASLLGPAAGPRLVENVLSTRRRCSGRQRGGATAAHRRLRCAPMSSLLYYATLAVESVAGFFGVRLYEEPRYAVEARLDAGVEIRRYEPRLAAEVVIAGATPDEELERAFRALFAYIAGANAGSAGGEKIAMTAPVEVARQPERIAMTAPVETVRGDTGTRMRFFLPARFTRETAPTPSDLRVRIVDAPPETLAVLRFSGTASDGEIAQRRGALLRALEASRWRPDGEPVAFFYDAPFTLPFVRRNEVAVPVSAIPASARNAPPSFGSTRATHEPGASASSSRPS